MRKNPADLTGEQRTSLAAIADTNAALYRSYLLESNSAKCSGPKAQPAGEVTGRVAVVGVALAHPRVRDPGSHHPPLPRPDLEHPRSRTVQRGVRSHQHPPAGIDQARLQFPQPRRTHRHGHAHPRRSLPPTTRTEMTHYNVSRSPDPGQEGIR